MKLMVLIALSVFTLISTVAVRSDCFTDTPYCPGFVDGGTWDPTPQAITEVARSTVGTVESCIAEGGKPYYQMCCGVNNKDWCELFALLDKVGWIDLPDRGYWCSEAVSYWHREASIPYEKGLAHPDDPGNWCRTNTMKISNWYRIEESSGGRGRWIDGDQIDYNNFQPGINAPCPGCFIALDACTISASGSVTWSDTDFHSLIIDDMTVYKDINHRIFKVEVDFIEGNSSHCVKADTKLAGEDHILSYTVKGNKWIGSNRKIYGFGIDLDSSGNPKMAKPVKYVDYGKIALPPVSKVIKDQTSNAWSKYFRLIASTTVDYRKKVKNNGGLKFSTNTSGFSPKKLPSDSSPWTIKPNPKSDVEVTVDLLDLYPESVLKIGLIFETHIPVGMKLSYAGKDKKFIAADVGQKVDAKIPDKQGMKLLLLFRLRQNGQAVKIRYIKLSFPKKILSQTTKITDLSFVTEEGPVSDGQYEGQ